MKFYGIKFENTERLIIAIAVMGDKSIEVSSSNINFTNEKNPFNEGFFEKNNYKEITRKEFNDFFILQNKNMNQFIKEL